MTLLEAVTVRTCAQASQAGTTHPVDIDAVNLGGLESAWAWSQAGQHQVYFGGRCSVCFVPSFICNTSLWVVLNAYALRQTGNLRVHGVRQDGCNSCYAVYVAFTCHESAVWQHMPGCNDAVFFGAAFACMQPIML